MFYGWFKTMNTTAPVRGPKMGKIVNRQQLAGMLGVSTTCIMNYVDNGCPAIQRGGRGIEWQFDTAAVFAWIKEQQAQGRAPGGKAHHRHENGGTTTAEEAKRRKAEAEAELKEYELAKVRGEMVAVSDVSGIIMDELASVRSRLMAIPGRLAQPLANVDNPTEVERLVKSEISEALRELTADQS